MFYARWFKSNNWGDFLNSELIYKISGEKPVFAGYPKNIITKKYYEIRNSRTDNIYMVIGSILHRMDKKCIIWGSGFISDNITIKEKPLKICAVRGPKSRKIFLKNGIECPDIYGDPGLLYPKFYNPIIEKKYLLGIVPHYVDYNNPLLDKFKKDPKVLVIDVMSGINRFVDNILSCNYVASSSLHGIIAADAYNIPSLWIKLSDKIKGGNFKFLDYLKSVKRNEEKPIIINKDIPRDELLNKFRNYKIDIDLKKLYEVCPFRK